MNSYPVRCRPIRSHADLAVTRDTKELMMYALELGGKPKRPEKTGEPGKKRDKSSVPGENWSVQRNEKSLETPGKHTQARDEHNPPQQKDPV